MRNLKLFVTLAAFISQFSGPAAMATTGDTAVGTVNIAGTVPPIFSLTTTGVPGDIDLSPGSIVIDRTLALLHFKYNQNVGSLKITSTSGALKNGASFYTFATPMTFKATGCASIDAATAIAAGAGGITLVTTSISGTPGNIIAGIDVKSAAAAALTAGVEEYCTLKASWVSAATVQLGGAYAMDIVFTMVAQ